MNVQKILLLVMLALIQNISHASAAPTPAPATKDAGQTNLAQASGAKAAATNALVPRAVSDAASGVKEPDAKVIKTYEAANYYGVPVRDGKKVLQYVDENKSQTHNKDHYVMIRVKGIKPRSAEKEIGRIRVAVWGQNNKDAYAQEGVPPFRASSHWAKDTVNGEMVFKIAGLEKGKSYSFFAHFDQNNKGKVERNFLGIPKDPYVFSNAANQGKGKGLTRDGLSAPKFEKTLVPFTAPGQEIILTF